MLRALGLSHNGSETGRTGALVVEREDVMPGMGGRGRGNRCANVALSPTCTFFIAKCNIKTYLNLMYAQKCTICAVKGLGAFLWCVLARMSAVGL